MKRLRSLLRLLRASLGESVYERENTLCRDLGRLFSDQRDAHVTIEAAEGLSRTLVGAPRTGRSTARSLANRLRERANSQPFGLPSRSAADPLREAVARSAEWVPDGLAFSDIAPGLRKAYRRGRLLYRATTGTARSADHLHEWRKRAKDARYHTEFLQGAWAPVLGPLEGEWKNLTGLLGDGNDLTLLLHTLEEEPHLTRRLKRGNDLPTLIGARREVLWEEAKVVAARLYIDSPDAFVHRWQVYWDRWEGGRTSV